VRVRLAPGLVGLGLEPRGLVPVDRQLGQDLERGAFAGAGADLLQVEALAAQQLVADAVVRLLGAAVERVFILLLAEFVEHLAGLLRAPVGVEIASRKPGT
jgi:hypothetical protein